MPLLEGMEEPPIYFPPGGWTQEAFNGPAGRWLLRDWVREWQSAKLTMQRNYTAMLVAEFRTLENRLFELVNNLSKARKESTEDLWQAAINQATSEFKLSVQMKAFPAVKVPATRLHRGYSVLIDGKKPSKWRVDKALRETGTQVAKNISGVSDYTKKMLSREMRKSIYQYKHSPRETLAYMRKKFPTMTKSRIATIVRTESGRIADAVTRHVLQAEGKVSHVSVSGCKAIEPGIPTYKGVPTCNIQNVPTQDMGQLQFHINHTGVIVPSYFFDSGFNGGPEQGAGASEE